MPDTTWFTPRPIIEALGTFDLDPCGSTDAPFVTAERTLTERDNGLLCDWIGRVWLNPPYGATQRPWMSNELQDPDFLDPEAIAMRRRRLMEWGGSLQFHESERAPWLIKERLWVCNADYTPDKNRELVGSKIDDNLIYTNGTDLVIKGSALRCLCEAFVVLELGRDRAPRTVTDMEHEVYREIFK